MRSRPLPPETPSALSETPSALREHVLAVLETLKAGEVVSYADVAEKAGHRGAARATGSVLSDCPETLPWWRVVYANGFLPPCNPSLQAERLAEEGVVLHGFRVVSSPHGRFRKKRSASPRSKGRGRNVSP